MKKDLQTKCQDCHKEFSVFDLTQVELNFPDIPKYKLVCDTCLDHQPYKVVGKFKK